MSLFYKNLESSKGGSTGAKAWKQKNEIKLPLSACNVNSLKFGTFQVEVQ